MTQDHFLPLSLLKQLLYTGLLFLSLSSCEDTEFPQDNMPYSYVYLELNLNSIRYNDLDGPKRYIYIDNEGLKGLIVYHHPSGYYKAFDRACPYHPREDCGVVEVHESNFYMKDECCGSTYDWDGFPTGGPNRQRLREYNTAVIDGYLHISSDPIFEE